MNPEMAANIHLSRLNCLLLLAITSATFSTGCTTARGMMISRQRDPMADAPRMPNANSPSLEQVVAHLNRNTDRIESWKTNQVRIYTKGLSVPLQGRLAVERGRHVRLEVTSPRGVEVDIGSNDDRFWVWSRHMDPQFVTCKHENTDIVRQSYGIPFEPDWLMEALGVSPIPTTGVTLEANPNNDQVRLVQEIVTAHKRPLRRVVLVDLKNRGIVTEHSLYDYNGNRIAIAKLSRHHHDKVTGIVLPHHVILDWPQNQMSVTMELGKVDINPKSISPQIWAMPERPGCKVVNLDDDMGRSRIRTRSASTVRLDSIEEAAPATEEEFEEELPDESDDRPTRTADRTGRASVIDDESEIGRVRFTDDDL